MRRLIVLLVVVLLAASCGSSESVTPAAAPTVAPSVSAAPDSSGDVTDSAAESDDERAAPRPTTPPVKTRDDDGEVIGGNGDSRDWPIADASALGTTAPSTGDIGDVDFFNDFAYPVTFGEELVVTVADGEFTDEPGYLWFRVIEVQYGDLDGDGTDEAVVQTGFNTGGSGQFGRLGVWDLVDDRVVERGWVGTGDRADGGLWHYEISDGLVITENFLTDQGACCPNMLSQHRLALASDGLLHVEHVEPLRWMRLNNYDEADNELEFLPGTSAAVVQLSNVDETNELIFEASAGQWVTTTHRRGTQAGVLLTDSAGTVIGQSSDSSLEVQLPSSGFFRVLFTNDIRRDQSTSIDLAITANPLPAFPGWTPAVRELIIDTEPTVRLLTVAPTFDLSDGGRLNGAIDAWLGEQTDWWVADVIEYPPVEREGSDSSIGGEYELLYDVTLAADDLASFRWNWYEYVCCRPYPNYGHASLVVDLAERRIIDVDEILDLDRLDEIHDIWIGQASAEEILPLDYLDWSGADGPAFSSLALTPVGVEFGTDRLGAIGGVTTVVPYEALGDLVDADLVARARTGTQPTRFAQPR